ncbi:hypothetical protein [Clostridium sardiniense]|uniref:hypothetical protein n=1 Tax=Clostridium sardiniense TaxID=29369 RepID=UPI001956D6B5|nr:hypothetical protein [Clostridium sardiniense]MBM7835929.1 hypothetical protein [Clostridium sardiniense]
MEDVQVMGYGMEFTLINLKLKNENQMMYDFVILDLYTSELSKGFKVKRINKTTRKGTKVNYESIKDRKDLEDYMKLVNSKIEEFKGKYKEAKSNE